MARLYIFILWLLHFLPLRVLAPTGAALGMLAYWLVGSRRRAGRVNLSLCFPELAADVRERLLRKHFRCFGRALVEAGIGWWSSPERLRRTVLIEGEEHIKAREGKPFILLVPHFVGIELEGLRITLDYRGGAVYVRQKDPYIDAFLKRKRERFAGTRMIARQEGVKTIVRFVATGRLFQLSPDMDLGRRESIFVPFFGVPAATVTALPRIAKLAGAVVLPFVVRQLEGGRGYVARCYPAWDDYPSDNAEHDVRRMNAFIEGCVREMPEQYLWTHRRFKTRPEGAPGYY